MSEVKLGDTFPPVSYTVDSEIVERFAEFMGISRHISGSTRLMPPSMFAYSVVWIACSYFAFQTEGALVASLDLELEGITGDTGTITVQDGKVENVFIRNGKRYVVFCFVSVDEHGTVVCRTRLTTVFRLAPTGKGQGDG
ncbi:MAG: hypothetical protein WBC47_00555 [Dehalococcoidia bacterium]